MLSFVYGDGNAAGKCWLRGGKVPLSGCLYWLRETGVRRGKKERKKEKIWMLGFARFYLEMFC